MSSWQVLSSPLPAVSHGSEDYLLLQEGQSEVPGSGDTDTQG